MPRTTVIMPAKNAQDTIGLALRSTLRSLSADSEIAVWDDASTDGTADAIARIDDKRITYTRSEVSVGGGRARQALIDASDSSLIACMDADDVCAPWRFRLQERLLSDADVVFGAAFWFGSSPRQLRPTTPFNYKAEDSAIALLFHTPFSHPTLLAKRSSLLQSGGYSTLPVAQDYELWLRCASRGQRIVRAGIPVVGYRQSAGQVSKDQNYLTRVRSQATLWESYLELFGKHFGVGRASALGPRIDDPVSTQEAFDSLKTLVPKLSRPLRPKYMRYAREMVGTLFGQS